MRGARRRAATPIGVLRQRLGPARAGESARPVARIQSIHPHPLAARRRMDEAAVAEVDADVRYALAAGVEEHEIPHLQFAPRHTQAIANWLAESAGRSTPST